MKDLYMRSRTFPIELLILIVFIAVTNLLAEVYFWYWRMRWFDMPMHFLGGIWLASTALWWRYGRTGLKPQSFIAITGTCLVSALGIGLIWEAVQAGLGLETAGHAGLISGTVKDLFFDTLGGISVAIWVWGRAQE